MNNLTDLREQIQEDIITYFSSLQLGRNPSWRESMEGAVDILCQIVVDRVNQLQENINNE